jgi:Icc-related predicted phosphoesterase
MVDRRDEGAAWRQALSLGPRALLRPSPGAVVVSHVPPRGSGDTPGDPYHAGFAGYAFIAARLRPTLWLHGHTNPAAQATWRIRRGGTTFVNATGSVLVELRAPAPPAPGPPT